jgi:FixJ family two-component response regulator
MNAAHTAEKAGALETKRGRVHVVTGDRLLVEALKGLLQEQGWELRVHPSVQDLSAAAAEHGNAVAVLDWLRADGMLGEQGRERLRALTERVPLVLLVPPRWLRLLAAERLGVAALLPKPVPLARLVQTLSALAPSNRAVAH